MKRLFNFMSKHPDKALAAVGFAAGFTLGAGNVNPLTGLGTGTITATFTLLLAHTRPREVWEGPHQ